MGFNHGVAKVRIMPSIPHGYLTVNYGHYGT